MKTSRLTGIYSKRTTVSFAQSGGGSCAVFQPSLAFIPSSVAFFPFQDTEKKKKRGVGKESQGGERRGKKMQALRCFPVANTTHHAYRRNTRQLPVNSMTEVAPRDDLPLQSSGKKQALISVSDKRDLAFLANGLEGLGYSIVSTGGTASTLEAAGIPVKKVEELTHFPEMLDGRVKTLHPNIHGGILARRDQGHHMEALNKHEIGTFDIVVVNLYPFVEKVTSTTGITFEEGIENIDIGGPTLIRAAAKNHKDVLVVVDSEDYPALLQFLQGKGDEQQFRMKLAWKAFQHVASYDSAVSEWLWKQLGSGGLFLFPSLLRSFSQCSLRYGENPHQKASFYVDKSLSMVNGGGIATAIQHHGKLKHLNLNIFVQEMSYNNYLDADAAWNCVSEFNSPTCVIVKHTNPCGVASRNDILEAYRLAVKADPVSAFGGIVAFNVEIDEDLAKEIREFRSPTDGETRMFYEIVVAPKYTERGLEVLRGKSKTLRILEAKKNEKGKLSLRQVGGGWLAQESDDLCPEDIEFAPVSEKIPGEEELQDAKFAWLCVKHVKSNAIVIAKNNCMLGMGSGQPNRLESLRIAFRKAGEEAKGAALASDAFFPFGQMTVLVGSLATGQK
ncbi:hypothetical protein ACLOJK_025362 [Asimina triloba]